MEENMENAKNEQCHRHRYCEFTFYICPFWVPLIHFCSGGSLKRSPQETTGHSCLVNRLLFVDIHIQVWCCKLGAPGFGMRGLACRILGSGLKLWDSGFRGFELKSLV